MKYKTLRIYLSECTGTALLILIGLSIVIFINGDGSPVLRLIPDAGIRRAITGWLFGSTGCLIALSPIGRISGAHINPSVSLAFMLRRKMTPDHTLGFVLAQMTGALLGALPLLCWGRQGASVHFGATEALPGMQGLAAAFAGETLTTFLLIAGILLFTGHRQLRRYTPFLMPPLFCLMVWAEGSISGTSTNPARSFGPACISGIWRGYWLYWAGPLTGTVLAVTLFQMPFLRHWKTEVPKLAPVRN